MPQARTPAGAIPWPTVPPPAEPLELASAAPGIIVCDSFFSRKTLANFVSFLESPAIAWTAPSLPKKGEATRTNFRFQVQDDAFAEQLWELSGLREALSRQSNLVDARNGRTAVGLNGNIRCYRYEKGSFFGRELHQSRSSPPPFPAVTPDPGDGLFTAHYDDDFRDPRTGATSEWTLLVYLSGKETGVKGESIRFESSSTSLNVDRRCHLDPSQVEKPLSIRIRQRRATGLRSFRSSKPGAPSCTGMVGCAACTKG